MTPFMGLNSCFFFYAPVRFIFKEESASLERKTEYSKLEKVPIRHLSFSQLYL